MNYQKIYDQLIEKRKNLEPLSDQQIGDKHHIIPRSLGGTEIVKLTIREHIFAHELLAFIYRQQNNKKAFFNMLMSLEMMVCEKSIQRRRMQKIYHKSRLIEKLIIKSRRMRQGKTRIKNVRLGKNMYWDKGVELPQHMIDEGWEFGIYLNKDQMKNKQMKSGDRKWIHKNGFSDMFVKEYELSNYINDGWELGRTNLPKGFRERASNRLKKNKRYRGNMRDRLWIYNIKTNECSTIKRGQDIPIGWKIGRINNHILEYYKTYQQMYDYYVNECNLDFNKLVNKYPEIKPISHKRFLSNCKKYVKNYKPLKQRIIDKLTKLAEHYQHGGFEECVKYGWEHSLHDLYHKFSKFGIPYKNQTTVNMEKLMSYYDIVKDMTYKQAQDWFSENTKYSRHMKNVFDIYMRRGIDLRKILRDNDKKYGI